MSEVLLILVVPVIIAGFCGGLFLCRAVENLFGWAKEAAWEANYWREHPQCKGCSVHSWRRISATCVCCTKNRIGKEAS